MVREKVDTMATMLEYVSKRHSNKKCLGTRQIKGEEDEVQSNGRVFKKVCGISCNFPYLIQQKPVILLLIIKK